MDDAWWRGSGLPTATEWQAVWGFTTFVIAGIAAAFALGQLRQNAKAAQEQSRPFVVVDFRFRSGVVLIEVKNFGLTAAKDIRFTWDQIPVGDDERMNAALRRQLVDGGIPFLAPGREIRFFLAKFTETLAPRQFVVLATYDGPTGGKLWDSVSVLDLDQWSSAVADTDHQGEIKKEIRRQTSAFKTIAKHLGELKDDLSPIGDWASSKPKVQRFIAGREQVHEDRVKQLNERLRIHSVFAENAAPREGPSD